MKLKVCSECGFTGNMFKSSPLLCASCARKTYEPKLYTAVKERKGISVVNLPALKPNKTRKNNCDKTVPELIKLATIVFNKWIKRRDSLNSLYYCVSCDKIDLSVSGHAGHYLSAGNNSTVRFSENNVHLQCQNCNINLLGNPEQYRINLINKIGFRAVERLELEAKKPHKWDKEELQTIITKYK